MYSALVLIIGLIGWGFNMIGFSFLLSTFLRDKMAAVVIGYLIVLFGPIAGVILEQNVFQVGNWAFTPILLIFPFPLTHFVVAVASAAAVVVVVDA